MICLLKTPGGVFFVSEGFMQNSPGYSLLFLADQVAWGKYSIPYKHFWPCTSSGPPAAPCVQFLTELVEAQVWQLGLGLPTETLSLPLPLPTQGGAVVAAPDPKVTPTPRGS